jgi:hypothetical protein
MIYFLTLSNNANDDDNDIGDIDHDDRYNKERMK